MPSDERLDRALRAVGDEIEAFRSAVARALDELRARLESRTEAAGSERWADALGPMARGRIDAERFAGLVAEPEVLDPTSAALVEEARDVLEELEDAGPSAFVRRVEPGADLRDGVAGGLSGLGRAFGAARTVELARTGSFRGELHGGFLDGFPPTMWNRAERTMAPPLVVRVRGADLRPGALASYLDGAQKLVLDVEGPAPPASLVRLITPGVLVLQTDDPGALERLAAFDGPAVAALFDRGGQTASFRHDPEAGPGLGGRLAVERTPEPRALRPVGAITVDQQREELEQLAALAGAGALLDDAPAGNGAEEPEAAGGVAPPSGQHGRTGRRCVMPAPAAVPRRPGARRREA